MGIIDILQKSIDQLEAQKNIEITTVTDRVTREKIIPNNQSVDAAYQKACAELDGVCSQKIVSIQRSVAEDKAKMKEAADKKKNEFAKTTIAAETYAIIAKYDAAIAGLQEQLDSVKE